MQNFLEQLKKVLAKDERLVSENGALLKNKIIELAIKLDKDLIELLLSDKQMEEVFFVEIFSSSLRGAKRRSNPIVFDKDKFIKFVLNKQFLPDSYTAFKNKIGLTSDDEFVSEKKEVVLSWPYKDCVLEGGQTKEDAKRDEIFWNQTLAPDEISRLLDPKMFTNAKRIDKKAEHSLVSLRGGNSRQSNPAFTTDANGNIKDNLIIKGNNLLALHSLKKRFAGTVKLIYIDPPYNTGNDSFGYNDRFNHSSWLAFMKNRLEAARNLLRNDGSIWINIDDTEAHYLKVLCDEIFGRENFINNLIWNKKNVVQNDAKYFNENHDHVLVFAKNKKIWRPNLLLRTKEMDARYDNLDNDSRGPWTSVALQAKSGSLSNVYKIIFPNGVKWKPVEGTYPRLSRESLMKAYKEGRLWFGKSGKNVPRLKKYLSEVKQGLVPNTIFLSSEAGSTQQAKEDLKKILGANIFTTPKPEKFLQKILQIASSEGDIVLDFFAGSATAGAVAMKMKRQFILCEQMEYVKKVTAERIKKVIAGEQGGISKEVGWKGGGDFVYLELGKWNENFVEQIKKAKTAKELQKLWKTLKEKAYLSYKVDIAAFDKNTADFAALSFKDQKRFLLETLDQNHLYINYSEIDDKEYDVSGEDKRVNKEFYE